MTGETIFALLIAPFVGSFLGVVVERLPAGRPIALERSRCDHCGATLSIRDLIPLVTWLAAQNGDFLNAAHLGWLSGWLMVLPNALLAFYYAARHRADIAYASQVGDGHICIPLCLGLTAMLMPVSVPPVFETGLAILIGAPVIHALCVAFARGLPRWMGWPLLAGYAWFLAAGLMN